VSEREEEREKERGNEIISHLVIVYYVVKKGFNSERRLFCLFS
jgi:hypothetical protein